MSKQFSHTLAFASCLWLLSSPWSFAVEPSPKQLAGAAHFSEEVFNMLFSHPVDDSEWVRQQIKSAMTSGQSQLQGSVKIDVMPDNSRGRLDFLMEGKLQIPHATATQREVRIHSHMQSAVTARKSVFFDQASLDGLPATAHCPTRIQIDEVQASRWLFERLAGRRASRQLPEVQNIVAQRSARRIENRLDERIGEAMESFETRLVKFLRFEGSDFRLFPPEVSFASTHRHLQLWIAPQTSTTLTRPVDASCLNPDFDIHAMVHQQVFEGFASYRMAGRRVEDQEVLRLVEMTRGNAPWSLWVHSRKPRWSVTLASPRPLDVRIADGNLSTTIRLDEFQSGSDVLHGPIQVDLTLRPEIAADGPRLHRTAGPEVRLSRVAPDGNVSDRDGSLLDLLRQKFEGIFPENIYFDRMQPPAGGSWDKVRSLTLERLKAEQEWFEIGFRFKQSVPPESGTLVDTAK